MLRIFKEGSIRWQTATLAILPIVLVAILGFLTELLLPEESKSSRAETIAAQITLVANQFESATTPEQADVIIRTTRETGLWVQIQDPITRQATDESLFEERILHAIWLTHSRAAEAILNDDGQLYIIVPTTKGNLGFVPPTGTGPTFANDEVINFILFAVLIISPVALLSVYAARLIARPLTEIAAAAQVKNTEDPNEPIFRESGPREIRQLARRLNEMRSQIQEMVTERTEMLRSVSHDLRTPLTRLKMRVERSVPPETGALLLRDIGAINDMIDDTLNFLRSESEVEAARKVDLPSLLGTISSDFSDMGHDVFYTGPDRLTLVCQPRALARAVSNLVDNATKNSTETEVSLISSADTGIKITVSDNGPGIPEEMRPDILKPFVTGDRSRTSSSRIGFGLGLAIAQEIAQRHGGELQMADRKGGGFTVSMTLPFPPEDGVEKPPGKTG